jgi:hypothetical protein
LSITNHSVIVWGIEYVATATSSKRDQVANVREHEHEFDLGPRQPEPFRNLGRAALKLGEVRTNRMPAPRLLGSEVPRLYAADGVETF